MDIATATGRLRGRLRRLLRRGSSQTGLSRAVPDRNVPTTPRFRVGPDPDVSNPVLTAAAVDDVAAVEFVADPFVVRHDGRYHLFFEIKSAGRGGRDWQYDIGHAVSEDGHEWRYEGVVLDATQAEHTYPYVFSHDGEWYMTPSPAGKTPREFRVYRADAFPADWTLVDRALRGRVRIDPTPFRHGGRWYLPYQETGSFDVKLAVSADLVGGCWRSHPASPLFAPGGNDVAPGGRPMVHEDGVDLLFRRGDPGLVEHWRLAGLTPESLVGYELPSSPIVQGVGGPEWNGRNMHHVDTGPADGPVLVDGQDTERRYRIGVYRRR